MLGKATRHRLALGRGMLATGLVISAGLLAAVGGWSGLVLALLQLAVAAAVTVRWNSVWPPAWAILALLPGPVAAVRHWTVQLPGACQCARMAHPPALVSLAGLAVLVDVALLGLASAVTLANRRTMVTR